MIKSQEAEKIKIPVTMMTQHPDAASKYIPIQEEPEEAIFALQRPPKGLGLDEVMIDFEGKLTPYQQTSQIVLGLLEAGFTPGRDVFITPRIPSGEEEGVFRQLMALMSIVESNYHSLKQAGIYGIREVILPMCRGSQELLNLRERIIDVIDLAHKEFGLGKDPNLIQVIPLIESIPQVLQVYSMLKDYLKGCQERGLTSRWLRVMHGCSDLALSYGLVPAVLANKIAISESYKAVEATGVKIFPIVGGGTLPFRGHFSLENVENTLKEYRGVRTLTLQSSMRYDYGFEATRKLAKILRQKLPLSSPLVFEEKVVVELCNLIGVFVKHYLSSFLNFIEPICQISDLIPKQRDRLARKSEVGYARSLPQPQELAELITDSSLAKELREIPQDRQVELPRAISYTGALYSIGLPPEVIGMGRGLKEIYERYGQRGISLLFQSYPSLKEDLSFSCRFLHLENASEFLPNLIIQQVEKDLQFLKDYLEIKIGPLEKQDKFYATILETMKPMLKQIIGIGGEEIVSDEGLEYELVKGWIVKLGMMRGALG